MTFDDWWFSRGQQINLGEQIVWNTLCRMAREAWIAGHEQGRREAAGAAEAAQTEYVHEYLPTYETHAS